MGVEQEIEAIRFGIRTGRFSNEASVSQGIVLRLLHALGWPAYNTDAVWPEYSLSGRRVDFALCSPPSKPIAFIEVKQIGQSDGAERQLFEYAYHDGVPMAILTDGREWNFFLPGEQGAYDERRVYKLDIVDRDVNECVERLERYLLHSAVASGAAIQAARDDYRNVSKDRQMLAALPTAWHQIILDEDEMLLEIVADRVENLCGFKPGPDMVATFLKESMVGRVTSQPQYRPSAQPTPRPQLTPPAALGAVVQPAYKPPPHAESQQRATSPHGQTGFSFEGQFHPARNAIDTLRQVFDLFIQRDSTFGERFAGLPKHGRTRRYLARDANELYRDRPDLGSVKLDSGWWMSTNHSRQTIGQIIAMACDVAHVAHGRDLIDSLGD
jgi:predicted type IV restriction endonuclease